MRCIINISTEAFLVSAAHSTESRPTRDVTASSYIAEETRQFARDIGLIACRTPYRSPQSNGMAEAFVKTFKRDYVSINPTPDGPTVLGKLLEWFTDYNSVHPHSALSYRSPDEFREKSDLK